MAAPGQLLLSPARLVFSKVAGRRDPPEPRRSPQSSLTDRGSDATKMPDRAVLNQVETRAAAILVLIAVVTAVVWVTSVLAWPKGLSLLIVSYTLGLR